MRERRSPYWLNRGKKIAIMYMSVCIYMPVLCALGVLTTSLFPVRPFDDPQMTRVVTREVEEFVPDEGAQFAFPFTTYVNHLYVHPRSLKYDGQKAFAKVWRCVCLIVSYMNLFCFCIITLFTCHLQVVDSLFSE